MDVIVNYFYSYKSGKLFKSNNELAYSLFSNKEIIELNELEYNIKLREINKLEEALNRFKVDLTNKGYEKETICITKNDLEELKEIWQKK